MLKPLVRNPVLTLIILLLIVSCMGLASVITPPSPKVQHNNALYDQAYGMTAVVTRIEKGGFYYRVQDSSERIEWYYVFSGDKLKSIKIGDKFKIEKNCNIGYCQHNLVRISS